MDADEQATVHKWLTAPEPDDPAKVASPWHLPVEAWRYAGRRSWSEFWYDHVLDNAGNLTYLAITSLFPSLLAILAALSLVGQGPAAVEWMTSFLQYVAPDAVAGPIVDTLRQIMAFTGAGWLLAGALVAALWAAAGYVSAFGRSVNRIYGVVEGRPLWRIIPYNLLVTLLMLLFGALVVLAVVLSASFWDTVQAYLGLPDSHLRDLRQNRWFIVAAATLVAILGLYRATPNVRQPRLRWSLLGAAVAMGLAFAAIFGLSAWVTAFPTMNTIYGVIGSFVILGLGLWAINVALLLGVELNAELERARLLHAGFASEQELLVRPRDTRMIEARAAEEERLFARGRALRRPDSDGGADSR